MEAAVFEDCYILIKNFAKCNIPIFANFCKEWKKLKFQHMYSAQSSLNEVMQTTSAIYHIAKRIACGRDSYNNATKSAAAQKHNVLCRIGGIYLLYAIYFKQPTKQYIKIQLSLQTWKDLCEFIEFLKASEYAASDEVHYIFWCLYKSDAYRFCAADHHYGLEGLLDYDCLFEENGGSDNEIPCQLSIKHKLPDLDAIDKKLADCIALEDNYNKLKSTLVKKKNIMSQSLPSTNIFREIDTVFRNIKKIIAEPSTSVESTNSNKKKELKRKAARISNNDKNNDEHNDEGKNDDTEVTSRSLRRISCRSLFAEKLPDHILKDLEMPANDEEGNVDSDMSVNSPSTTACSFDMNEILD